MASKLNLPTSSTKEDSAEPEQAVQGGNIKVIFHLEEGRTETMLFREGHTVDWLKSQLDRQFGIPFEEISLFYNERMMPDPLSLIDLGITASSGDINITVKKSAM